MRSRYPRNHISEGHYPIKQVVVFFIYTREQKVLIVRHTLKNRPKNEILSYTHIFVVRKSYNTQKAQDIAYLVLFCYYILCFCRWTKSLNLTAAFRRFFQKTGLELTTYRFCSIGYYNFIIIFKREQVFRFSLFCCCLSVVFQR